MKTDKTKLFFGTNNLHKLEEIHSILGDKYDLLSFRDLENPIDVEETELTLQGNAILKAKSFFAHTGISCFADDTGLEVDALDGAPGVFSARYAGGGDNTQKLLSELADATDRSAQFRTVIAYYDGKSLHCFEGIICGQILKERRGSNGFGYDPVFLPEGEELTFGQMPAEQKGVISHRSRAVGAFVDWLKNKK